MSFGLARKAFGATLVALIAMASPARAAISIVYQISADTPNNSSTGGTVNAPVLSTSGTLGSGSQTVTYILSSAATQSSTLGTLTSTSIDINNSNNQERTITILVSAIGYEQPSPTATLSSSASGTSANFTPGQTATLQSFADADNRPFGSTATTGPQTGVAVLTPGDTTANYIFPLPETTAFVQSGLYSLTQSFTIILAAGRGASLTLSTNVTGGPTAVIPEPATVVTALSALPALGIYLARRRRQKA